MAISLELSERFPEFKNDGLNLVRILHVVWCKARLAHFSVIEHAAETRALLRKRPVGDEVLD